MGVDQLNFSYYTKFLGEDLLDKNPEEPRAFISNYQKVAYMKKGQLTVLEPKEKVAFFSGEQSIPSEQGDQNLLHDAITYYQYSSEWRSHMKRISTVYEKK